MRGKALEKTAYSDLAWDKVRVTLEHYTCLAVPKAQDAVLQEGPKNRRQHKGIVWTGLYYSLGPRSGAMGLACQTALLQK